MTSVAPSTARLPDWSSLSELGRIAALEQCRRRLAHIGRMLHAVEHIYPAETLHVRARSQACPMSPRTCSQPDEAGRHGDVPTPQAPALPRASVIDRLDQAGASLIGTATMTELAYEPSGIGAARRAQSMAVRCDPRRLVDGLRHSGRIRLLFCRAWLRYRRLGANSRRIAAASPRSNRATARSRSTARCRWRQASTPSEFLPEVLPILRCCGRSISGEPLAAVAKSFRERLCCRMRSTPATPRSPTFVVAPSACSPRCGMTIEEQVRISRRGGSACADGPASGGRARAPRSAWTIRASTRRCASASARASSISDQELASALAARDALRDQFILSCLGEAGVAVLPVMPIRTPRRRRGRSGSAAFQSARALCAQPLHPLRQLSRACRRLLFPQASTAAECRSVFRLIGRPGSEAAAARDRGPVAGNGPTGTAACPRRSRPRLPTSHDRPNGRGAVAQRARVGAVFVCDGRRPCG